MRNTGAALLCSALVACAVLNPPMPAAVSVEAVRAAPAAPEWDRVAPPPIYVLVDLTSSMQASSTGGVSHLRAAQQAAGRFLRSLPADADVSLHVLGAATGSACTSAVPLKVPLGATPGEGLARVAEALPSRSESSLASSLEAIARLLPDEERVRAGVRVLAITDLDGSCQEGSLCDAAAALYSAGADLDLVVIGQTPVPDCLEKIGGDEEPPLLAAAPLPPVRAEFRVFAEEEREGAPRREVGKVGGAAVNVAAGLVRILVDVEPPVEVGPVELAPTSTLRIRILEVPGGEPRRWQVFVNEAEVGGEEGAAP
jgi:hypothetical protein